MVPRASAALAASIRNFQKYLETRAETLRARAMEPRKAAPFITISRQAGAGGHSLAEAILEEMGRRPDVPALEGWQILDREICERVMLDYGLKVSVEALLAERYRPELMDYLSQIVVGTSPQHAVYGCIFRMVRTLAMAGKVVVVGRAGSLLTRDLPGGIHFRLVASRATRIRNMARTLGLGREQAEREMEDQDASRAMLVRDFFMKDIESPLLYDAVWNMDRVAVGTLAGMAVDMVEATDRFRSSCAAG